MPTFDPISGAPISSLGTYLTQDVTQTLSLGDSLGLQVDFNLPVEHTISLTDSVALNTVLGQSFEHTLTLTDALALTTILLIPLTDTLSLTDAVAVQFIDNTEPSSALTLSHDVLVNVIRLFFYEDFWSLTDIALRDLSESVSDTITFTHELDKVTPDIIRSSTLTLTHSVSARLALSLSLVDTLTFSQTMYRILTSSLSDTITFTDSAEARNLPLFDYTDYLTLVQGVEYLTNLDTVNGAALQLSHTVDLVLFPVQNLSQTISLTQAADLFNLTQQNLTSDLTFTATAASDLFEQQDMLQLLVFSHVINIRNLQVQNDPNTLYLTHSVMVTVTIAGIQNPSDTLNLRHAVVLNQEKFFEICHCLNLSNSAHRAYEFDVEHDLILNDSYIPGQPQSDLVLSHQVGINVSFDECCGTVFVQDKIVKNTLTLSHSVSTNQSSVLSPASSLVLNHTAAYYIL